MKFTILSVVLFFLLLNSSSFAKERAVLTQQEAQARFKQISNVSYKLSIDLTKADYDPDVDGHKTSSCALYSSRIAITFTLSPKANQVSKTIFLDFSIHQDGNIESVFLNNKVVNYEWDDKRTRLIFPVAVFKLGKENQLTITFKNRFAIDGTGFNRSIDLEDKSIYVFTDFEPYDANDMFPLFDQPDLKATFQLETLVPSHWEVFSNTLENEKVSVSKDRTRWSFNPTEKISSYLFAVAAGPFQVWRSQTENGIPLRIMARKTFAKYVNNIVPDWFKITQQALQFYENTFDYPYPFKKYDQILLPDIASEAMENVGLVTFQEDYISQSTMLPSERIVFARVINHEMAHMWFGNLVTMKWWDDLWLNESFATFASFLTMDALSKKLDFVEPWQSFNAKIKQSAYLEDSFTKTTHPVVGTARDTIEASSSFDDITYNKGAAVLKQLYFYIGKEVFLNGLKSYFKKYAFKNATRVDFLNVLAQEFGSDLNLWDEQWLQTKGHNAVKVNLFTSNNLVSKLSIEQLPDPMEHRLRSHRAKLGFYDQNDKGEFVLRETIDIQYSQNITEVREAIGKKAPAFVFINSGDHDFIQIIFDEEILTLLQNNLYKIADPLLKQQLYFIFWNMVRENHLTAEVYVNIVKKNIPYETDIPLLELALSNLKLSLKYMDIQKRLEINDDIATFLLKRMYDEPDSVLQKMFSGFFLDFAYSQIHLKTIESWLMQKSDLTQAERWKLISVLARGGYPDSFALIQSELKKDPSNDGLLFAQVAESRIPDVTFKKKWFGDLSIPKKVNFSDARSIMLNFHDILDESLTQFVEELYFDPVLGFIRENDIDTKISVFASLMYPISYKKNFADRAEQFVEKYDKLLPLVVKRAILMHVEDTPKIIKAREF